MGRATFSRSSANLRTGACRALRRAPSCPASASAKTRPACCRHKSRAARQGGCGWPRHTPRQPASRARPVQEVCLARCGSNRAGARCVQSAGGRRAEARGPGSSLQWVAANRPAVHWLFRASDDTYVNIANLAAYAAHFPPHLPFFLGDVHGREFPYADGGAGFLLSRAAFLAAAAAGDRFLVVGRGDTDDTSFGKFMHEDVGVRALQGSPFIGELYCFRTDAARALYPSFLPARGPAPRTGAGAGGRAATGAAPAADADVGGGGEGGGASTDVGLARLSIMLVPWPGTPATLILTPDTRHPAPGPRTPQPDRSTLHPTTKTPSTLNPQPSTLNSQPSPSTQTRRQAATWWSAGCGRVSRHTRTHSIAPHTTGSAGSCLNVFMYVCVYFR